ncbi:MAG: RNA methyltransferase [Proteobacteria bacterium]|nr:RNA methyltransferase [Pseudomonadota bacterium]
MAGTDRSRSMPLGGPVIVLVEPQLGENIGACARAMLNFGLRDLRLVRPRDGWPNDKAVAASSRATEILDNVRLYSTTTAAIADLGFVLAATARPRDMKKDELSPRRAAARLRQLEGAGAAAGILFGREATGLDSDDVALADAILSIPANPAFASLNLGQAVLLTAYEWFLASSGPAGRPAAGGQQAPATRDELLGLFEHLEDELDARGFLKPPEKKPRMIRNIRNLFHRAALTGQEVRTLRGVVTALTRHRKV